MLPPRGQVKQPHSNASPSFGTLVHKIMPLNLKTYDPSLLFCSVSLFLQACSKRWRWNDGPYLWVHWQDLQHCQTKEAAVHGHWWSGEYILHMPFRACMHWCVGVQLLVLQILSVELVMLYTPLCTYLAMTIHTMALYGNYYLFILCNDDLFNR